MAGFLSTSPKSRWLRRLLACAAAAPANGVRLHVQHPLAAGAALALSDNQHHYLSSVMRLRAGDSLAVFNGVDGEWIARVAAVERRSSTLEVTRLSRPQSDALETDGATSLAFAVLKSSVLPMLVQKATELGASKLCPIVTKQCAVRKLNVPRLQAVAIEAAEQSGRLTVPSIEEPKPLGALLQQWQVGRLLVCDERGAKGREVLPLSQVASPSNGSTPNAEPNAELRVLVGPEGGFSPDEFEAMQQHELVEFVSLGRNVLRAETAALAAMAIIGCR